MYYKIVKTHIIIEMTTIAKTIPTLTTISI